MSKCQLPLLALVISITMPSGFAQAAQPAPLIRLVKESIIINSMATGKRSIERTGRCEILSDGTVRHQLFQGSYKSSRDEIANLTSEDQTRLQSTLLALKNYNDEKFYLTDYDFTGDNINVIGTKFVKNDDGKAYVDSQEIPFYRMRRRLMRTYNGPESSALRLLIKKYCFMNI